MKLKKLFLLSCIFAIIVTNLFGCGESEMEISENKQEQEVVKRELSNISVIASNQTFKYTEDVLDCPLYEWGDVAVYPIPTPDGYSSVEMANHGVWAFGIDKEEWLAYLELLKETYEVVVDYNDYEGNERYYVDIWDRENNFYGCISWDNYVSYDNMKNALDAYFYVGSDESVEGLDNDKVLEMVKKKLYTDEEFQIINVTSKTNVEDGFGVYYIETTEEYRELNRISNYLCIIKDGKIVHLDDGKIYLGSQLSSVEFLNVDGQWRMYIFYHDIYTSSEQWRQLYLECVLKGDEFVRVNSGLVEDLSYINGATHVVMKKEDGNIQLYELILNENYEKDESIFGYELWLLGDKLATLQPSKEISKDESYNYIKMEFEEIVSNNGKLSEEQLAEIDNIEMTFLGDKLYFVDIFDGNKLKVFDMTAKELKEVGIEVGGENRPGTTFIKSWGGLYYDNGISLYKIYEDGSYSISLEDAKDKDFLMAEDFAWLYIDNKDNQVYHYSLYGTEASIERKSWGENELTLEGGNESFWFGRDVYWVEDSKIMINGSELFEWEGATLDICINAEDLFIYRDGYVYQYGQDKIMKLYWAVNGKVDKFGAAGEDINYYAKKMYNGNYCIIIFGDTNKRYEVEGEIVDWLFTDQYGIIFDGESIKYNVREKVE